MASEAKPISGMNTIVKFVGLGFLFSAFAMPLLEAQKTPDPSLSMRIPEHAIDLFAHLKDRVFSKHSDVDMVMPWQNALEALGYDIGKCGADGFYGDKLVAAMTAYRRDRGMMNSFESDIPGTLDAIYKEIKARPDIQAKLDDIIIAPFKKPEIQQYFDNLSGHFSFANDLKVALRPDVVLWGYIYARARDDERVNKEGREIYGGCAQNREVDAYRHGTMLLNVSMPLPWSGYTTAHLMNIRERRGSEKGPHPAGVMLVDMFNHFQTAKLTYTLKPFPWQNPAAREIMIEQIKSGNMVVRPFPLVPKAR